MQRIPRYADAVDRVVDEQAFLKEKGLAAHREAHVGALEVVLRQVGEDLAEVAFEEEAGNLQIELIDELSVETGIRVVEVEGAETTVAIEWPKSEDQSFGAGE